MIAIIARQRYCSATAKCNRHVACASLICHLSYKELHRVTTSVTAPATTMLAAMMVLTTMSSWQPATPPPPSPRYQYYWCHQRSHAHFIQRETERIPDRSDHCAKSQSNKQRRLSAGHAQRHPCHLETLKLNDCNYQAGT